MRVLVTGANGFVGGALVAHLAATGHNVRAACRAPGATFREGVEIWPGLDIGNETGWAEALAGVECVVHCAARVHRMREDATPAAAAYMRDNVDGTVNIARLAARAGVRRFVFVSSLKAQGEETQAGKPFFADDHPQPADPYGISKLEAERALLRIAGQEKMQAVIIRPPLIYGAGARGNMRTLMRMLEKGIPLPLGAIHNQRSLAAVGNVVSLIETCMHHPAAANQRFLVSDGQDVSTTELLRATARALGVRARLLPLPDTWLARAAKWAGKAGLAQRLCGNLQADITKTRTLLNWQPPVTMDTALREMAEMHKLKHEGLKGRL